MGALLMKSHVTVFWTYILIKLWQSIDAHSSYDLPFPFSVWTIPMLGMDCSPAHHYHHNVNIGNYGGWFMFWDHVCGTNVKYNTRVTEKLEKAI